MTAAERHHHMVAMRDLYSGTHPPAVVEIREPVRLIHMRQSGDRLLIAINDGGEVSTLVVSTLDAPGLELLSALDRAHVQSALKVVQKGGLADAA